MDTGRKLPRNANFMEHLPLAMPSMAKRRTYFPVNGQTFTSSGNNIIRIDISGDAFLDTKNSYLTFRYNNTTGTTMGFDYGGGHGVIRRLRIEQAENYFRRFFSRHRVTAIILSLALLLKTRDLITPQVMVIPFYRRLRMK